MFFLRTDLGLRVDAAFTDRSGGVSVAPYDTLNLGDHVGDDPAAVAENRRRVAAEIGAPDVVYMQQVHGAHVTLVDGPTDQPVAGTDGLVTATPGIGLAVLVADCVPVLLADPRARVIAAVHAGRRGVAVGVVPAAVEAMTRLGARPTDILALSGPSICGGCYEVPSEMRDDVAAAVPAAVATTRRGSPGIDCAAGVWSQLEACGVPAGRRAPECTAETATLFSYRRDHATGRFAGLVVLQP